MKNKIKNIVQNNEPNTNSQKENINVKKFIINRCHLSHLFITLALGVAEAGGSPVRPAGQGYTARSGLKRKWGWGGWCLHCIPNFRRIPPTHRTPTSNSTPRIREAHHSSAFTPGGSYLIDDQVFLASCGLGRHLAIYTTDSPGRPVTAQ